MSDLPCSGCGHTAEECSRARAEARALAAESERDAAREALRQVAEQAHATAVCYLEYGMEEIRRYSAANDLTEIRDAARAALAGKGGNTNG